MEEVRLPEVPVMLMVNVPEAAVLVAFNVRTLEPVVGLVAKLAVTPFGRLEAASVTLPVKPLAPTTEIVLEAWPPCVIDKLFGEAASV